MQTTVDAICDGLPNNTQGDAGYFGGELPRAFLSDFSWRLDEPITSMINRGDSVQDDVLVTSEYLDTVFLQGYTYSHIYVVVQVGRWFDTARKELIELPIPCTPRHIFDAIHAFYQRPVTFDFVRTLRSATGLNEECDSACRMIADGKIATNLTLMGGLIYFEGLQRLEYNVYRVCLGS
jgi:hypothetical protein